MRGSERILRERPRVEAGVSELGSGRCESNDDDGGGRSKNEAMQLDREISGKPTTKAQENWEGWGRSSGTVPVPVRGRTPQS